MNIRTLFILFFLISSNFGDCQSDVRFSGAAHQLIGMDEFDKNSVGIITGWHQFRYSMMELGIGVASSDFGHHGNMFRAVSLSAEINPWKKVVAYKASVWKSIPMIPLSFGLNGLMYTQFDNIDWTIRPMLGVGYNNIHFTYGLDISIGPRDITERNLHTFSLRYFIPVIKLK